MEQCAREGSACYAGIYCLGGETTPGAEMNGAAPLEDIAGKKNKYPSTSRLLVESR